MSSEAPGPSVLASLLMTSSRSSNGLWSSRHHIGVWEGRQKTERRIKQTNNKKIRHLLAESDLLKNLESPNNTFCLYLISHSYLWRRQENVGFFFFSEYIAIPRNIGGKWILGGQLALAITQKDSKNAPNMPSPWALPGLFAHWLSLWRLWAWSPALHT